MQKGMAVWKSCGKQERRDGETMVSKELVKLLLEEGALRFGDFTTKSGRKSPYFVDMGRVHSGASLSRLAAFYADKIVELKEQGRISAEVRCIFGPAYKGISLAVSTSIALHCLYGWDLSFGFNRKERKDHGEGGDLVGYPIQPGDSILILEDVITAGTAIRESLGMLEKIGDVRIEGILVCLDRMEKGISGLSAVKEIQQDHGIPVCSLLTLEDILMYLMEEETSGNPRILPSERVALESYFHEKGVRG